MNEISIPPLPHFPNPLAEIQELQKEMVGALGDLFAEQSAMRGVLESLAATHPEPKLVAEAYLQHMDSMAESIRPERIERYRAASQRWRDLLLACANQKPLT